MRQTETTSHTEAEARYPRTILGTACVPWRADWSLDEDLFSRWSTRADRGGHEAPVRLRNRRRGLRGQRPAVRRDYARVPRGDARARTCIRWSG